MAKQPNTIGKAQYASYNFSCICPGKGDYERYPFTCFSCGQTALRELIGAYFGNDESTLTKAPWPMLLTAEIYMIGNVVEVKDQGAWLLCLQQVFGLVVEVDIYADESKPTAFATTRIMTAMQKLKDLRQIITVKESEEMSVLGTQLQEMKRLEDVCLERQAEIKQLMTDSALTDAFLANPAGELLAQMKTDPKYKRLVDFQTNASNMAMENSSLEGMIRVLGAEIREQNTKIEEMNKLISYRGRLLTEHEEYSSQLQASKGDIELQLTQHKNTSLYLNSLVDKYQETTAKVILDRDNDRESYASWLRSKDEEIEAHMQQRKQAEAERDGHQQQLSKLETFMEEQKQRLQGQIGDLEWDLLQKGGMLEQCTQRLKQAETDREADQQRLRSLEKHIGEEGARLQTDLTHLKSALLEKENKLKSLKKSSKEWEKQRIVLEKELLGKTDCTKEIIELRHSNQRMQQKVSELEHERISINQLKELFASKKDRVSSLDHTATESLYDVKNGDGVAVSGYLQPQIEGLENEIRSLNLENGQLRFAKDNSAKKSDDLVPSESTQSLNAIIGIVQGVNGTKGNQEDRLPRRNHRQLPQRRQSSAPAPESSQIKEAEFTDLAAKKIELKKVNSLKNRKSTKKPVQLLPVQLELIEAGNLFEYHNVYDAKEGTGANDSTAPQIDAYFSEKGNKGLLGRFQAFVEGASMKNDIDRVKIAIIDSGLDMSHPAVQKLQEEWPEDSDNPRFTCRQFYDEKDDAQHPPSTNDEIGHGTHLAVLLANLAPRCEVYVARVTGLNNVLLPSSVARALECAVKEWQVDIVSLSLGFKSWNCDIERALNLAHKANTLIFAANSNEGANTRKPSWPAREPGVFGINSCDWEGTTSGFNIGASNIRGEFSRYKTIGQDVLSAWPQNISKGSTSMEKRCTGTSVATPIAAGIAALLMQFVRQTTHLECMSRYGNYLETPNGMKLAFDFISNIDVERFSYLMPWEEFHLLPEDKMSYGKASARVARLLCEHIERHR